MQYHLEVENIKCGGCANSIIQKISALDNVNNVEVNVDKGAVSFETDASNLNTVQDKLHSLGYPVIGSVEGLDKITTKAKSFVSCAIGKIK
ncbi:Heavy metal transport/detoxification protein [hydrothermal vent metagenome]|uniref:Heavy metal transport/detoxification protein n=1 Tax=hydrothermal vent metagenome TaxID=652676 RepID=A0A1W1CG43_9ZZZZ